MPKLIFTDKNLSGRTYELVLERTTVGRGDQNTLVIRDPSLSFSHCEILMYGAEIIVRDLDSRNGTFVDEVRLNKQAQLKSGHTVRFGAVEARLELEEPAEEDDASQITAIYTLGKIMRDQRRAQKQAKPGSASMALEPEAHPASEGQTILIPRTEPSPRPPPAPAVAEDKVAERASPGRSWTRLIIVIALLAGLLVVAWLIWRRK